MTTFPREIAIGAWPYLALIGACPYLFRMAHNPSDAMVRLLRVAIGGVGMLVSFAVTAAGVILVMGLREPGDHGAFVYIAWATLTAGVLGILSFGGYTLYLVVDWRRNRGERSHRP